MINRMLLGWQAGCAALQGQKAVREDEEVLGMVMALPSKAKRQVTFTFLPHPYYTPATPL
jgi:hypothetical protein